MLVLCDSGACERRTPMPSSVAIAVTNVKDRRTRELSQALSVICCQYTQDLNKYFISFARVCAALFVKVHGSPAVCGTPY